MGANEIIESFEVTPNTNLLDVLGNAGYSLQAAIADIIDNSITNKAKNIWVDMHYAGDASRIIIRDDGNGMSLEKLKQASTPAFRDMNEGRDLNDLGRFSIGLNSASKSMCEHLMIQSKIAGQCSNTVSLDYEKMKCEGWKCYVINEKEDYIKNDSGTAIIWNRLKQNVLGQSKEDFYEKIAMVETHISHVFGDYIGDGLNIYIAGDNLVKAWDPFYLDNIKTSLILDRREKYKNSYVDIKVYILPPYNNLNSREQVYMRGYGLTEQQGFYIYRNKRLIKEGGWLGLGELSISNKYDYARIRIDIDNSLDKYFNPNFLKSDINIPNDLKELFYNIAVMARKESNKSFNYMKAPTLIKSVKKNNLIPVWNCKNTKDGILININEAHPIIKSLLEPLKDSDKKRLFKLLAKNIPIGEISRSGVSKEQNTYSNIEKEMNDMFDRLKEDGLSDEEIMKKMVSCEPFCLSDDYIGKLITFFGEKGVLQT